MATTLATVKDKYVNNKPGSLSFVSYSGEVKALEVGASQELKAHQMLGNPLRSKPTH